MNATTTRTALALIGAAGAATGALLLHRHHADTKPAAPKDVTCGAMAPAHAEGKLTHGKLSGAMSAGTLLKASGGDVFAAFELTTDEIKDASRPPLDLALVIDRSGSMSGRIGHAQAAA